MSDLRITFPDNCNVRYKDSTSNEDTIVVEAVDCSHPPPPTGNEPLIGSGTIIFGIIISFLLVGGFIIAVATVRHRAQELKPDVIKAQQELQQAKNAERQQEIDGQVRLAKAHRQCMTCGTNWEPELK